MSTRAIILAQIEAFLTASGMSAREFSLKVAGDHKFVTRLRAGKGISLTLIERAEALMRGEPVAVPKRRRAA